MDNKLLIGGLLGVNALVGLGVGIYDLKDNWYFTQQKSRLTRSMILAGYTVGGTLLLPFRAIEYLAFRPAPQPKKARSESMSMGEDNLNFTNLEQPRKVENYLPIRDARVTSYSSSFDLNLKN